MGARTVQVRIGSQSYRLVTTVSEAEVHELAGVVERKLATVVPPGRAATPQAMLLAAIALAHDVEIERARASRMTEQTRLVYQRLAARVDEALRTVDAARGGGSGEAPESS